MNELQVLNKLSSTNGSFARIFKAIADPPTTSLQCLKGCILNLQLVALECWKERIKQKDIARVEAVLELLRKQAQLTGKQGLPGPAIVHRKCF
ncbi:GPI ethanolamine phosphate transferase 3 [Quillaja saponaria]|uniref:GPI ethanolamine phosphate transferase 3 n=1 Tax=Quillaja saponaria TaxID=32244 RepID=A0AAD7LCT2_QUISA|nr:GPI ethanolamine phosphate transferase 3 [Quillaja saponaria]